MSKHNEMDIDPADGRIATGWLADWFRGEPKAVVGTVTDRGRQAKIDEAAADFNTAADNADQWTEASGWRGLGALLQWNQPEKSPHERKAAEAQCKVVEALPQLNGHRPVKIAGRDSAGRTKIIYGKRG